jgi:hypothetical protein
MRSRHDSNLTYIFSQNSGLFDLQILLCSRTPYILERLTGEAELNKVALRLNQRPRKILGFETSASKRKPVLPRPVEPARLFGNFEDVSKNPRFAGTTFCWTG